MDMQIDTRFIPIVNTWNSYLKDNGSVVFGYDDDDEDCEILIIEYKHYKGLPSSFTKIDSMAIYKYVYEPSKLFDELIIPQTKILIAGYKNSKEYKASKYYKLDIINQRKEELEEDFK